MAELTEAKLGRRAMLGALAAGGAWLAAAPWLPLDSLPGLARFRIYNVAGHIPRLDPYILRLRGVGREAALGFEELGRLPQVAVSADFHCVTGWSVPDVAWRGIRVRDLLHATLPGESAAWIHFHSADGVYSDSLRWEVATGDEVLLATMMEGRPLSADHGGPGRLLVAPMYGYKSVKWLDRIELSDEELVGYWEQRGYSSDAFLDPPARPRINDPVTRRFPDAGVVLAVPKEWAVTPGQAGGITVVTAAPGGDDEASLALYDYRSSMKVDVDALIDFATSGTYFGAGGRRQSLASVDGHQAVGFDYEKGAARARDVFVAHGKQILLVAARAPAHRWSQLEPTFSAIVGELRLEQPRFEP